MKQDKEIQIHFVENHGVVDKNGRSAKEDKGTQIDFSENLGVADEKVESVKEDKAIQVFFVENSSLAEIHAPTSVEMEMSRVPDKSNVLKESVVEFVEEAFSTSQNLTRLQLVDQSDGFHSLEKELLSSKDLQTDLVIIKVFINASLNT